MNPLLQGAPMPPMAMPAAQAQTPGMGNVPMQAIQSARRMMSALRTVQNPQAALQQAAKQNPMLASVMAMCNGRNPQEVFYEQCQRCGVDPQQIMGMLMG